jgi:hypothetical protein
VTLSVRSCSTVAVACHANRNLACVDLQRRTGGRGGVSVMAKRERW